MHALTALTLENLELKAKNAAKEAILRKVAKYILDGAPSLKDVKELRQLLNPYRF